MPTKKQKPKTTPDSSAAASVASAASWTAIFDTHRINQSALIEHKKILERDIEKLRSAEDGHKDILKELKTRTQAASTRNIELTDYLKSSQRKRQALLGAIQPHRDSKPAMDTQEKHDLSERNAFRALVTQEREKLAHTQRRVQSLQSSQKEILEAIEGQRKLVQDLIAQIAIRQEEIRLLKTKSPDLLAFDGFSIDGSVGTSMTASEDVSSEEKGFSVREVREPARAPVTSMQSALQEPYPITVGLKNPREPGFKIKRLEGQLSESQANLAQQTRLNACLFNRIQELESQLHLGAIQNSILHNELAWTQSAAVYHHDIAVCLAAENSSIQGAIPAIIEEGIAQKGRRDDIEAFNEGFGTGFQCALTTVPVSAPAASPPRSALALAVMPVAKDSSESLHRFHWF